MRRVKILFKSVLGANSKMIIVGTSCYALHTEHNITRGSWALVVLRVHVYHRLYQFGELEKSFSGKWPIF